MTQVPEPTAVIDLQTPAGRAAVAPPAPPAPGGGPAETGPAGDRIVGRAAVGRWIGRAAVGPVADDRVAGGVLAYLEVLFATMAAATTGVLYSGFFTSRGFLLPLMAAAALAALLAIVSAARRFGVAATVPVAALGFVVLAVALVYRSTLDHGIPTVHTATALGTGLLHGWARMLSVGLPADVSGDLLVMPVLVTFLATVVSTTLALRTRVILAPALPTLLALVTGLLFTAGRPAAGVAVTAAFLVETLLLLVVRVSRLESVALPAAPDPDGAPPTPAHRRALGRIVFGVPVALVVAALGVAAAQLVPVARGTDRFDPRSVVPQHFAVQDTLTPLVGLKSQLRQQPAQRLFTVRVTNDGGVPLDRVRTAALDDYDGALWTADDTFLVAGHTLPTDPDLHHPREVSARIDVADLTGPYLPVLGWPVKVAASPASSGAATGIGFSATSGVLVGSGADLHGIGYDLVGDVPVRDAGLAVAVPDLTGRAAQDTALPAGLPDELAAKARDLTGTATTPFGKLTAIESYLRKLPYSLDARPGHSYDALRRLFSSNPQDRVGYAEQFAAAFAVLARSQGFPARVAVGYLLRTAERDGDTYTVTTADAHAWAEVNFSGYGWVSFDPTDVSNRGTIPPQQQTTQPGDENKPADSNNPGSQPIVDPRLHSGPSTRARILTGSVIAAIALAGLAVLGLVGIVLEKLRRRLRRRRGTANERIIGAWRDSTDRLVEHGIAVPQSLTAIEVAAHAEERLGDATRSVATLAPIVTAAVFYPGEPADDSVSEAWELAAQLRRDLRRSRGIPRAVRAWFDPRPLVSGWRYRRRLRGALKEMQEG